MTDRYSADAATALLIPLVIFIHLWAAPFTKIEESFNIEATHDLMTYGFPKDYAEIASKYEHALYPGPVPRTFVGPVLLAAVGRFWQVHLDGLQRQILGRCCTSNTAHRPDLPSPGRARPIQRRWDSLLPVDGQADLWSDSSALVRALLGHSVPRHVLGLADAAQLLRLWLV